MYADLVVDASGRGSKTPKWLTALGYIPPEETVINAHLGYASRLYKIPVEFNADWKAVYIQVAPPKPNRAGMLFPVEGDRWIVSLGDGKTRYLLSISIM